MKAYKTMAHIHSLDGAMDEITVLDKIENQNQPYYIVNYRGVLCTAIFNYFTFEYYADDKYSRVEKVDNKYIFRSV